MEIDREFLDNHSSKLMEEEDKFMEECIVNYNQQFADHTQL